MPLWARGSGTRLPVLPGALPSTARGTFRSEGNPPRGEGAAESAGVRPMSPRPPEEGSGLGRVQRRSRSPGGGHPSAGFTDDLRTATEGESSCQRSPGETAKGGQERGGCRQRSLLTEGH